jgi:hypothetical protein
MATVPFTSVAQGPAGFFSGWLDLAFVKPPLAGIRSEGPGPDVAYSTTSACELISRTT